MMRIQRKRTKGWKAPPNTVYVGRPSKWGNPFKVEDRPSRPYVLNEYRRHMLKQLDKDPHWLDELKGKNLSCWCKESEDCHVDILIDYIENH